MEKYENYFIEEEGQFDLEHETRMLMYRFMSLVDKRMEELEMNKKDLAEAIGTSPSYITQLFNGTKIVNLQTLAKFQNVLDLKFEIREECKIEESKKKEYSPVE